MKKYLAVLVCVLFIFTAAAGVAQDLTGYGFGHARGDLTEGDLEPGRAPSEVRTDITGTVEKTYAGLVINAVDGQYLTYGEDLSAMVGKQVIATGDATQVNGKMKIFVISYKEVK